MDFVGALVSLDCGQHGIFQGVIDDIDTNTQAITLSDVFENGKPHESTQPLQFSSNQIVNLSIIKSAAERTKKQTTSEMVMVPKAHYANNRMNQPVTHPAARVYNQSPIKYKAREQVVAVEHPAVAHSNPSRRTPTDRQNQRINQAFPNKPAPVPKKATSAGVIVLPKQLGKSITQPKSLERDEHGRIPMVSQLLAQHSIGDTRVPSSSIAGTKSAFHKPTAASFTELPKSDKQHKAPDFSTMVFSEQSIKRPTPTKPMTAAALISSMQNRVVAGSIDQHRPPAVPSDANATELLFSKPSERNSRGVMTGDGNPMSTSSRQRQSSTNNHWMAEPINHNEMASDFDFESNLALFQKLPHAGEGGECLTPGQLSPSQQSTGSQGSDRPLRSSGKKEKVKNYRHDENVLSDPNRITSWVAITPKQDKLSKPASATASAIKKANTNECYDRIKQMYSAQSLASVPTIPNELKRQIWGHVKHETSDAAGTSALTATIATHLMNAIAENLNSDVSSKSELLLLVGQSMVSAGIAACVCQHLANRDITVYMYRTGVTSKAADAGAPIRNLEKFKNVIVVNNGKITPPNSLDLTVIIPDFESTQPDRFTQVWTNKFAGQTISLDVYLNVANPERYSVVWCWLPDTQAALDTAHKQYVVDCGVSYSLLKPLLPVNTYSSMKRLFSTQLMHSMAVK